MKDHWLVWTGAVDSKTCDNIVRRGEKLSLQSGVMGDGELNKEYRSSTIGWFSKANGDLVNIIDHYVGIANASNFGFDISYGIESIQFATYEGDSQDRYDWHTDTFFTTPGPYHRKLSLCLQLSDPDEYEGGEFEMRGCDEFNNEVFKPKGSILVFPSIFQHRILPITSGVRHSLVSWIHGPKWR